MQPAAADPKSDRLFETAYRFITDGATHQGLDTNNFSLEGAGERDVVYP